MIRLSVFIRSHLCSSVVFPLSVVPPLRLLSVFICGYLCSSVVSPLFAKPPEVASWEAGTAKVVITPKEFMWMSGYGGRTKPAEGKMHELWAKALALKTPDGDRCVLITMDLCGIDRELSTAVCENLQKRNSLPRSAIHLNVSHTHCGPVVGKNLRAMYFLDEAQTKLVDEYTKELEAKLVQVAEAALKDMKRANLAKGP